VSAAPRSRLPRRAGLALALLAISVAPLGCATLRSPESASGGSSRAARPDAPPEYDVLVGSLAALDGDPEQARDAFARAAEKDPDSAYLQRALGRLSAQLDQLDDAQAHAERAVALDPEDAEARVFLGRLLRIRRDVEGAERALLDPETSEPVSEEAALLLYQVYLEASRFSDALRVAQDLLARDPGNLGAHMAVATAYERMGELEKSEQALRRALDEHPGRFVLYSRLARIRRAEGDREGEIAVYREVLKRHPRHYGTLMSLGEAQIALDDLPGAIETYSSLVAYYPEDQQSIRRLASLEFAAGRPEAAAARLEAALARNPDQLELAYALGQVWRGSGDDDKALEAFGRIPESHPAYPDARLQVAAVLEEREDYAGALREVERVRALRPSRDLDFHAAALMVRTGDLDGGVAMLQALLDENPDDDEILYQIGVLYGMAKHVDQALATMQRALEKNPENAHALNYIGYTWAERGENLDQAEKMIVRALELRPDDGYITDSLGWLYYMRARPMIRSGRKEAGLALLEQAREKLFLAADLTGGDPVVSEHLGDVHLLMDQKEQALHFYEEAVRLEPRADEQPHLMDKLEELRRELSTR
jgi:tetratricopeptide (TPR) repeat protein